MFKILIIGYSSLVKRRIIATLVRKGIPFDIASRSKKRKDLNAENWFHGYDQGLKKSNASIAYISLPNSLHYFWGKKALKKNFHTLIDKPATINSKQLKNLFDTAKKKKKILSEALFFNYHAQMKFAIREIQKKKVDKINVNFSIPKPDESSILSSKKLKGGVIMDMGPYIAAVARLFFKSKPKKMIKNIEFKNKISSKINTLFIYKNSSFFGKFSHNDNYQNFIEIYLKNKIIKLSRVFSPPALEKLEVLEIIGNKTKSKKFSDDIFQNYIEEVFYTIKKKKYSYYKKRMTQDIKIREYLQKY